MTPHISPALPSTSTAASTWPKGLELRLLGEPEFRARGKIAQVKFTRPRCIEILALCALHAERGFSRTAICGLLWPDLSEEDARANLRRHLSELSATLAPFGTLLLVDRQTVRWNLTADAFVDVIAFETLAAEPATYDAALALYRGDLLGAVYEDWLLAHRDRFRSTAVMMHQSLGDEALRARDYPRALAHARRALDLSEWREDTLRLLMTAMYAMGNRAEALAEFDRFARTLASEMRVDAMHETLALRDTILANLPVPEMLPSPIGAAKDEEHALVGRDDALATLVAAWDRALRGAGNTIFIGGEAGIGKSRLTRELVRRAEERGARALWSSASPDATAMYQPLIDVVRAGMSSLAAADLDEVWFSSVAGVIPELASLRPDAPDSAQVEANRGAERVREGFARALLSVARRKPALVVVEDVHWADVDTIDALAHLSRRIRGSAILLVLTHRSEETPLAHPLRAMRRTLLSEHRANMLSLGGLSPDAVLQLVHAAGHGVSDAQALAAAITRVSGGNPLFALQMLRHHAEAGAPDSGAPLELEHLLRSRIELLAPHLRSALSFGALIDERFSVEELAEITGHNEANILDSVDALIDARYLIWSATPGFTLRFSHQLLRVAVLAALPTDGRTALHRRAATVLERTRAGDASATPIIARHFALGEQPDRGFDLFLKAANSAAAMYAPRSALDLAHSALDVAQSDAQRFLALRIAIAAHATTASMGESYDRDIDAYGKIAARIGQDEVFEAGLARCSYEINQTASDTSSNVMSTIEGLLKIATQSDRHDQLRLAYEQLGRTNVLRGNVPDAVTAYRKALEYADSESVDALGIRAALVGCYVRTGDRETALREFSNLEAAARDRNDPLLDVLLASAYQGIAITLETPEAFEAAGYRLIAAADRVGALSTRAIGMSLLANAAYERGDVALGRKLAADAFAFLEEHDLRQHGIALRNNIGVSEREFGNLDAAMALWNDALASALRIGDKTAACCSYLNIGDVFVERGDGASALHALHKAIDLTRQIGDDYLSVAAAFCLGAAEFAAGKREAGLERMRASCSARRASRSARQAATDLCEFLERLLAAKKIEEAADVAKELSELYREHRSELRHPMRTCLALSDAAEIAGDAALTKRYRFEGVTLTKAALERLPDEETRANFAAMPFNKRLLALKFGSP